MRAAIFKEGGKPWAIEDLPDPTPGHGEAVLKIGRCGICGTDLNMTSGHGYDFPCGSRIGHEFSGEVVAVGPGVDNLKVGDRVAAMPSYSCGTCELCVTGLGTLCPEHKSYMGGFGEYLAIAASKAVKLPEALSLSDGALVEPLAIGLHGANLANIAEGARILVLGGGTVGLAATYWARRLGAGMVATASRSQRRAEKALEMGADAFVQTGDGEIERVNEALGGPPDIVFEGVGVPGMLGQAVNLVRPNGHIVSLGFCMSPDPIIPGMASFKQARFTFAMSWTLDEFQQSVDTLDAGHVEPRTMVTKTIGLDDLPAMVETLRGPNSETKVHVDPFA